MFQRSNVEFCQAKSQNKSASEREKKLKDLAAAYDSFMELRANLQEGTKVSHALRSEMGHAPLIPGIVSWSCFLCQDPMNRAELSYGSTFSACSAQLSTVLSNIVLYLLHSCTLFSA